MKTLILTFAFLTLCLSSGIAQNPVTVRSSSVGLEWDASPSAGVEGYRLYMRTAGTDAWGDPIATVPANVLSVASVDLADEVTYEFVLKAFAGKDESGPSNMVSVSYSPLEAGVNLRVTININATIGIDP